MCSASLALASIANARCSGAHAAHTLDWFVEGASRPEGFDLDFEKMAKLIDCVTSLIAARQMLETAYQNSISFLRSRTRSNWPSHCRPAL
jgi:hypothetical protein